jgi:hypothetical protein
LREGEAVLRVHHRNLRQAGRDEHKPMAALPCVLRGELFEPSGPPLAPNPPAQKPASALAWRDSVSKGQSKLDLLV